MTHFFKKKVSPIKQRQIIDSFICIYYIQHSCHYSLYSPPVADEDLLVEDGSVGTEEGGGVEAALVQGVTQTHVIDLTPGLILCIFPRLLKHSVKMLIFFS